MPVKNSILANQEKGSLHLPHTKIYKQTLTILIMILLFLIVCWMLFRARKILVMLFVAYLITLAVKMPIAGLKKWTKDRLSLVWSAVIVYLLIIVAIIAGISLVIPNLVTELLNFAKTFNVSPVTNLINNIDLNQLDIGALIDNFGQFGSSIISGAVATFGGLFTFMTTFIISFHLAVYQNNFHNTALAITRNEGIANIAGDFSQVMAKQLGGWLRGEFVLMLIIGLTSYIAFALLGIPYALPLAVLAGLLELLPNIGPIVASVPAVALALTVSWPIALATLAVCVVIQQLENTLIVPRVMKAAVNVNPVVSIILVLAGFQLFGVFGSLLAIPVFLIFRTAWIYFIRDKKYIEFLPAEKARY